MMTHRRFSLSVLSMLALTLCGPSALAGDSGDDLPLQYSHRPLTLTQGVLAPAAQLSITKLKGNDDLFTALDGSVAYGITDVLQVHALVLPIMLSPDADYGNPVLGAIYRLMDRPLQIGAKLELLIPVQDGSDFALTLGVPIEIEPAAALKIITGAEFIITFGDSTQTDVWLPVEVAFSATPNLFFQLLTGFQLPDTDFDLYTIPLRLGAGYTVEGPTGGPLADITVDFGFPSFATNIGDDTINADVIEFRVGVRGFLLD